MTLQDPSSPRGMRPLEPAEFKRSPKMMAHFNSYEEYWTKIVEPWLKLQEFMGLLEEDINLDKIEPIEPWETNQTRRKAQ